MNQRFFLWLETRSQPELRISLGRKPCLFSGLYFIIDTKDEEVVNFEVSGSPDLSLILSSEEIKSFTESLVITNSCHNGDILKAFSVLITVSFLLWLERGSLKEFIPLIVNPVEDEYLLSEGNLKRLFLYFNTLETLQIIHPLLSIQKFILSFDSFTMNFENRLFLESCRILNKRGVDLVFPQVLNEAMNKLNFVSLLTSRNFDTVCNIKNSISEQIASRDKAINELERKLAHLQSSFNLLIRNYKHDKSNERV